MKTSDFDFELPESLIASRPLEIRDASRMLVVPGNEDKHIRDFLDYLQPGDVVVFNNSRVIPARFNASGFEITLHTSETNQIWWGLAKKFNKLNIGDQLELDDGTKIVVLDKNDDSGLKIEFQTDDIFACLDRVGKMPLPPYMKREDEQSDRDRYQTVYADPIGSMAAPTAGLHFTPELLREIENRGAKIVNITLHVGAGTWMPVKSDDLSQHKMHSEWGCITADQVATINAAKRVVAVGTTSLRLLESAAIQCDRPSSPLARGVARSAGVSVPQSLILKERARELRKSGSLPEVLLWKEISGKKINGLNFNRQKVIGNYIVDFYCPLNGVVIEIDDATTHNNKGAYDERREKYLMGLGLTVIHVSAQDVLKDMRSVIELLRRHPGTACHPSCQRGITIQQRIQPFCGLTDIFITPGYKFKCVDVLLTNFHLPKSTLFMLVSAFAGMDEMRAAYKHAVEHQYRFFSYGDCCLLFKKDV